MTGLMHMSLDTPEETRPFEEGMGHLDLVDVKHGGVGRAVFEPGWQWSKHVKPIAGTDSCQASHMGYCVSGHMHIRMDDGQEADIGPGEFLEIPPGHDGWVVGDEPCVMIDWQGYADYAKKG
jgi:quercetin dioxygenase-like cupin family protein